MARACLEGLAAQPGAASIEVFVVGSVRGIDPPPGLDVTLIEHADLHTNRRRQAAIDRARAPLVALLDDDTVPLPGWLEAALAVDPDARVVLTGPEHTYRDHPTAALIEAVTSSVLTEGSLAHRVRTRRDVGWTEVPFANVVLPRRVLDEAGGLGLDIPADADDLEFTQRCRHVATFRNEPDLLVIHDRYPPTIRHLLHYRWRVRRRVGEKLITLPSVYGHIPQALVLAGAPPAGLLVLAVGKRRAARLAGAAYGALLVAQAAVGVRRVGWRRTPAFVGVTVALHAVNLGAVQVGLARALAGRASTGRYDGRDHEWSGSRPAASAVGRPEGHLQAGGAA